MPTIAADRNRPGDPSNWILLSAADSQVEVNATKAWEMEGGALSRHVLAGTAAGSDPLPANRDAFDHETEESVAGSGVISLNRSGTTTVASGYPKFRNDRAVPEIRIGVREFNCIGVSPPHDHPHVYINMGEDDTILCPYCATRYRYDPRFAPFEADPQDCLFVNPNRI